MIEEARAAGFVIKLLAVCERIEANGAESISVRVYPALVPTSHPLASVHGANNAVFVEAEAAGSLMFYGAGAGGVQTASAVLGDVVSAARRHIAGGVGVGSPLAPTFPSCRSATSPPVTRSRSRSRMRPACWPPSRASSATATSRWRRSCRPSRGEDEPTARLIIGTHRATEQALSATVDALADSEVVARVVSVLRVEGE